MKAILIGFFLLLTVLLVFHKIYVFVNILNKFKKDEAVKDKKNKLNLVKHLTVFRNYKIQDLIYSILFLGFFANFVSFVWSVKILLGNFSVNTYEKLIMGGVLYFLIISLITMGLLQVLKQVNKFRGINKQYQKIEAIFVFQTFFAFLLVAYSDSLDGSHKVKYALAGISFIMFQYFLIECFKLQNIHFFVNVLRAFSTNIVPEVVFSKDKLNKLTDFSKNQILETISCINCGRCQNACPAYNSGLPLSPRVLMNEIKDSFSLQFKKSYSLKNIKKIKQEIEAIECYNFSDDKKIDLKSPSSCVFCGACDRVCPTKAKPMEKIHDLIVNETNANAIQNEFEVKKENSKVDVTIWLGCKFKSSKRNEVVLKSFEELMQKAAIRYAVIDSDMSCGEDDYFSGNIKNAEVKLKQIVEKFKKIDSEIVSLCPHCTSFINEKSYNLSFDKKIISHTEYLYKLINVGKLRPLRGTHIVYAFHDACRLSRSENIINEPRKVLSKIPYLKIREVQNNNENTFCCGGNLSVNNKNRITKMRIDELSKTNSQNIVTCCLNCLNNFEENLKEQNKEINVYDISEILNKSV